MRHQKKLWPIIILNLLLWGIFTWIIIKTSPDFFSKFIIYNFSAKGGPASGWHFSIPLTKIVFFTDLLLSLTLTLGLILKSTKKAFALSLGITIFLILKMFQLINWLNIFLLTSLVMIMFLA